MFGGEALYSEDSPGWSIGSAELWFEALAALIHASNDSGAFGIIGDTRDAVLKKFCFFFHRSIIIRREFGLSLTSTALWSPPA